jgi:hypothetical protein
MDLKMNHHPSRMAMKRSIVIIILIFRSPMPIAVP